MSANVVDRLLTALAPALGFAADDCWASGIEQRKLIEDARTHGLEQTALATFGFRTPRMETRGWE